MTSIYRRFLILAVSLCSSCAHHTPGSPAPMLPPAGTYSVTGVLHVRGDERWDYITIDPRSRLLYLPRQTHTQMVLATTGELVADVKDTAGVHGVALVPELHRAFASDGQSNSVTVFDLDMGRVLGTIAAGEKPDAIIYDFASKMVLAFNGKSHDVTVIDPSDDPKTAVTRRIALDGAPEFAAADGQGFVYVNLEDRDSVAVINTSSMTVVNQWQIEGGEGPSGIAVDPVRHRVYTGCHNQVLAVLDTQTGKTLATLPIGKGVDGCAFDAITGKAFASCGDGTLTVARETAPGRFEVIQVVTTLPGARTMALDPVRHAVYLPTAQFPQARPASGGKPAPIPGSFVVLVVTPGN